MINKIDKYKNNIKELINYFKSNSVTVTILKRLLFTLHNLSEFKIGVRIFRTL